VDLTTLEASDLEEIASQGNMLPDKENPDKNQGKGFG